MRFATRYSEREKTNTRKGQEKKGRGNKKKQWSRLVDKKKNALKYRWVLGGGGEQKTSILCIVRMQVMARKLYQNLGDRMSRCFAINPVGDGRMGKYRAVGGRATRVRGRERDRGKGGSKTGNSRGRKKRARGRRAERKNCQMGWMGLGWSWGWKQMASFVLRLLRGESRDGKSRTRFRVTCDY